MADDKKTEAITGKSSTPSVAPGVTSPNVSRTTPSTVPSEQKLSEPNFATTTTPGTVAPKVSSDKVAAEKEKLHTRITEILKEHGNLESDIPLGNEYWNLLNQLRALS